mgnify:CR=1 FL=1
MGGKVRGLLMGVGGLLMVVVWGEGAEKVGGRRRMRGV